MTAQDFWREGRLAEAIEAQIGEVKANPLDVDRRYFLFALFAFSGNLERAAKQLDALGTSDQKLAAGTIPYHNLLAAEADRRRVLAGEADALIPDDAPESLRRRARAFRGDRWTRAELEAIEALETATSGTCDGDEFRQIHDTDEALGPTVEMFAGGRWLLLPFGKIRSLSIREPRHVLDLLWVPASLEDRDGVHADVHLPVLYPASASADDDGLRLGRGTEWVERDGVTRGVGQRVWCVDAGAGDADDDRALLAIRELELADRE
ncbi:MAG: type VI secretion system accessory protein TagJ [bacterium]